jgi:hypothetical protein
MTLLKTEYVRKGTMIFNGRKSIPENIRESIVYHTSFLDYDAPILTRVTYLFAELKQQKTCSNCKTMLRPVGSILKQGEYCSLKCSNSDIATKEKRKKTNIERHGVENLFSKPNFISDIIQDKYGVKNVSELPHVKEKLRVANTNNSVERQEKIKKTNIERYGVEHAAQRSDVVSKIKQTNNERYGTECAMNAPSIRDSIKKNNIERYGVENPAQTEYVKEKIKKTKLCKYGDENYNNRAKASATMDSLYGDHYSKSHWDEITTELMADAQLLGEFVKGKTIDAAAIELNIAPTTLRTALYKYDIVTYDARKNQYEEMIADLLRELGIFFIRNDRLTLSGKELDFFIPAYNIAIECNGIFWHSELMGKTRTYHLTKTDECAKIGIHLIHLWDYLFDDKWKVIKGMLIHAFGRTPMRIPAKKLNVQKIDSNTANNFFVNNHLFGNAPSSVRYGLMTDSGELVSCMTFGKSRFNPSEYELIRFATLNGKYVQGGASKLFTAFLRDNTADRVITYANRDHSLGNLYTKLGFTLVKVTPPSYHYFKNRKVFNRLQFQKHRLSCILDTYSDNLSEWENMKLNGYNRFWNTGNFKYEYIRND